MSPEKPHCLRYNHNYKHITWNSRIRILNGLVLKECTGFCQIIKPTKGKCEFAKGLTQMFQLRGVASQRLGSLLIIPHGIIHSKLAANGETVNDDVALAPVLKVDP